MALLHLLQAPMALPCRVALFSVLRSLVTERSHLGQAGGLMWHLERGVWFPARRQSPALQGPGAAGRGFVAAVGGHVINAGSVVPAFLGGRHSLHKNPQSACPVVATGKDW